MVHHISQDIGVNAGYQLVSVSALITASLRYVRGGAVAKPAQAPGFNIQSWRKVKQNKQAH